MLSLPVNDATPLLMHSMSTFGQKVGHKWGWCTYFPLVWCILWLSIFVLEIDVPSFISNLEAFQGYKETNHDSKH